MSNNLYREVDFTGLQTIKVPVYVNPRFYLIMFIIRVALVGGLIYAFSKYLKVEKKKKRQWIITSLLFALLFILSLCLEYLIIGEVNILELFDLNPIKR